MPGWMRAAGVCLEEPLGHTVEESRKPFVLVTNGDGLENWLWKLPLTTQRELKKEMVGTTGLEPATSTVSR
jgi:hypothetical protein